MSRRDERPWSGALGKIGAGRGAANTSGVTRAAEKQLKDNQDQSHWLEYSAISAKLPPPNRPPQESGPVRYVRSIRVMDANGIELTLYEFHERHLFRKVRRLKLETGEIVQEVRGQLVIVGTGETLIRR